MGSFHKRSSASTSFLHVASDITGQYHRNLNLCTSDDYEDILVNLLQTGN
jgi:hypothetical protein